MSDSASGWPEIPVAEWVDTRDTLQLMTQVVGKVRMENTPLMSHWWNVVLYVSARGLTTGLIPHGGRAFSIDFDFFDHQLVVSTTNGDRRSIPLKPGPIADFYRDVMAALGELGLSTEIWTMPVEIPDAIPFDTDQQHVAYDGDQAHRFWLALVQMNRVFEEFRSRYIGKVSPVHFFWGALDLAVTRFSGRTAPKHPGGAPNCGPHVMWEAYSHEVSSAGYWPGPGRRGRLLLLRLPRTARISRGIRVAGTGNVRRSPRRVHIAVHRCARSRRPRRPAARLPTEHLRGRRRQGRLGPRGARTPVMMSAVGACG